MSEKRYSQEDVDAVTKEVLALEGLSAEEVAAGKAEIEKKHGLSPGGLSKPNPSTVEATLAEAEKKKIYEPHYEATMEEVEGMTMEQYAQWSRLGAHTRKSAEEVERDIAAEERDRAKAEENAKMAKMPYPEYKAYREEQARKAKEKAEQEEKDIARLAQEKQQKQVESLRYKNPDDMSMTEYIAWRKSQ